MISFSKAANYSILVVSYLASKPVSAVLSNAELAQQLNLPADYLSKILQKLAHSGIIDSIKGINGGYTLSLLPENINLKKIVESVDGPSQVVHNLKDNLTECGQIENTTLIVDAMENFEIELNNLLEKTNFFDLIMYISNSKSDLKNSKG